MRLLTLICGLVTFCSAALRVLFAAGALLPGALVDAQVTSVVSDGLTLSFLTFFSGTVDQFHLGQVSHPHFLNFVL